MAELKACKSLGWDEVHVVPLDNILRGEFDENAVREDFTPSECVAITGHDSARRRAKRYQPQWLAVGTRVSGNLLQALAHRLRADIEPLTRHRERQSRRAAVDPRKDFGGVQALEQVLDGGGQHGGGMGYLRPIIRPPRSIRL